MADIYSKNTVLADDPAVDGFTVIPSNSTVFTQPTRFIYVGSTGNVGVQMTNKQGTNTNLVLVGVPVGTMLSLRTQMIFASNTTATSILGLF